MCSPPFFKFLCFNSKINQSSRRIILDLEQAGGWLKEKLSTEIRIHDDVKFIYRIFTNYYL